MGTRLMQWTAAEMDGVQCNGLLHGWCNGQQQRWMESDAMDCCSFVNLCFLVCASCWMWTDHNQPISIQEVSNFAFRKLVLIYIHKKETKDSQCASCSMPWWFLSCSLWHHLSCSPFCHVLSCAECIITRADTRAHVLHLFSDDIFFGNRSGDPKDLPPKGMRRHS